MKLRQFIDAESSTYTYLLYTSGEPGSIVVDPTESGAPLLARIATEMGLRIALSLETHTHADHVTGAYRLRRETGCRTLVSRESGISCADGSFSDGDEIRVGNLSLRALYTPGHTDDSYCFLARGFVLTGDTLLIRGTGRTDFQNGDARAAYRSLTNRLLVLDDSVIVYPGHDYQGLTSSTIGEERRHNPRLKARNEEEYVAQMAALRLPPPRLLEIAVSRNRRCGAP